SWARGLGAAEAALWSRPTRTTTGGSTRRLVLKPPSPGPADRTGRPLPDRERQTGLTRAGRAVWRDESTQVEAGPGSAFGISLAIRDEAATDAAAIPLRISPVFRAGSRTRFPREASSAGFRSPLYPST